MVCASNGMTRYELIIRNVRTLAGAPLAIGMKDGRVAALGEAVDGHGPGYDGKGCTALRGLHDHHIHVLATAAAIDSVDLSSCTTVDAVKASIQRAAQNKRPSAWIRATGYDERVAGLPDATQLDGWCSGHPLRMQDRTGAYWLLNSIGVSLLGGPPWDGAVELDGRGKPNGRIRRGDAWLRQRIGSTPPDLTALGTQLARWGVTAVTDATAHNGPEEAALLAGALPQRLTLMGSEALAADHGYVLGPLKLHYDEAHLPDVSSIAARIRTARSQNRAVAAHCVGLAELLCFLAALDEAGGSRDGDRIELAALSRQA
jgi:predicted amidohydrolase YtcJ